MRSSQSTLDEGDETLHERPWSLQVYGVTAIRYDVDAVALVVSHGLAHLCRQRLKFGVTLAHDEQCVTSKFVHSVPDGVGLSSRRRRRETIGQGIDRADGGRSASSQAVDAAKARMRRERGKQSLAIPRRRKSGDITFSQCFRHLIVSLRARCARFFASKSRRTTDGDDGLWLERVVARSEHQRNSGTHAVSNHVCRLGCAPKSRKRISHELTHRLHAEAFGQRCALVG